MMWFSDVWDHDQYNCMYFFKLFCEQSLIYAFKHEAEN